MKRKRGNTLKREKVSESADDRPSCPNRRSSRRISTAIASGVTGVQSPAWSPCTELEVKTEPLTDPDEDSQQLAELHHGGWSQLSGSAGGVRVKEEPHSEQPHSSGSSNSMYLAEHFGLHIFKEEIEEVPGEILSQDPEDHLDQEYFTVHEPTSEIFSGSSWPQHFLVDLQNDPEASQEINEETSSEPTCSFQPSEVSEFAVEVAYKSIRDTDKHFKYYQCPQCKLYFNSSVQLHEHILGNTDNQQFKSNNSNSKLKCGFFCNICKKRFSVLKALKMHEIIHDSSLNVSPVSTAMVSHMSEVDELEGVEMETPEDSFTYGRKCKICFKWLASGEDMDRHLNSHIQFKPYQCKKCDQKFGFETEFKAHSKVHEIAKNARGFYVCLFCEKGIKGFGPLKTHMKNVHNENLHKLYHMKE